MSDWHIREAADAVVNGGIIAYPTESVFGLGCDPLNENAVFTLLALKKRSWQKGLILVASHIDQVWPYIKVDNQNKFKKVLKTWPGPITWLLPKSEYAPDWISGAHDSVAVRISAFPVVQNLCKRMQQALVSTSANPSERPPATNALEVERYFGGKLDYVIHSTARCNNAPTEIWDYDSLQQIR